MGFTDVHDYAEGKVDWIAQGLPTEGAGPHYAVVGEVADRDAVLACRVGDLVGDLKDKLDTVPHDYCVVLNDSDIVLGRIRKNVKAASDESVELVMEPGPTTLRPKTEAEPLLERMKSKKVSAVIVTTKEGRLIGAATRKALQQLVERTSEG